MGNTEAANADYQKVVDLINALASPDQSVLDLAQLAQLYIVPVNQNPDAEPGQIYSEDGVPL